MLVFCSWDPSTTCNISLEGCNTLQHSLTKCDISWARCKTLQHSRQNVISRQHCTRCNTLQHTATLSRQDLISLQHAATHCNTRKKGCFLSRPLEPFRSVTQYAKLGFEPWVRGKGSGVVGGDVGETQHRATPCSRLQRSPTHCNSLQHTQQAATHYTHCSALPLTATHCNTLQHRESAPHCNTLQHTTAHCITLQHTATHCNTQQHTIKAPEEYGLPRQGCARFAPLGPPVSHDSSIWVDTTHSHV